VHSLKFCVLLCSVHYIPNIILWYFWHFTYFYIIRTTFLWWYAVNLQINDLSRKIWTTKGEELEAAKKGFFEWLKLLEGELGEKPYFGGETLGYVDIAFLPFCCGFSTYETIGNFSIEAQCPKIIAWAKRCLQKESVAKSLAEPGKLHELVLEMRKSLGFDWLEGYGQGSK
jgi:glutathione S-transferase